MSAIDDLFSRLKAENRKALMPFLTAGDPNIETTAAVLGKMKAAGADLCEVGIPYSDPIADGPVIQASYQRALESGFRLEHAMQLGREHAAAVEIPMVTMVSYSIIYRVGLEKYVDQAMACGYRGAIVPDLLVEEANELSAICKDKDFSLVQLVTPTTPKKRQVEIANSSTGFLYYVSVTGITGERTKLPTDLTDSVSWLRGETDLPICIGFGISGPETAARLAPVADGLIVGSAVVRRIAENTDPNIAAETVSQFVGELRAAIDSTEG
ncbi:tryptophan synthase subunit alpha [Rhodopirellula sp. MGV]|uniref:tryptophan synthase subunit alpha n=1 Tax=Rhodopirellula sp. MGV TaxID=2023130 RepID=UPI000B9785FE|nr:tryptophan synthase subunit alpha [Rhodopirellula sp. MGV]OYP35163.1 tryptophan synthase subunit alpha [Rhodopirellula sp. MGV]PNY37821.1 tryptophan synthase subunit alpha [Rhodopirellula baltica]